MVSAFARNCYFKAGPEGIAVQRSYFSASVKAIQQRLLTIRSMAGR